MSLKFFNLLLLMLVTSFNQSRVHGAITKCEKSVTTTSGTKAVNEKKVCSGDLIFEESFDGTLDMDIWQHDITFTGDSSHEFQWYTNNRSNSFVDDGNLNIRPTLTADDFGEYFLYTGSLDIDGPLHERCTNAANSGCRRNGNHENILNPVKSARLRTLNSFAFKYGKVEIAAKLPAGDWLLPSIKFLPLRNSYGGWPASGEIDLFEARGNRDLIKSGVNIGIDQITSSLHFGPYAEADAWQLTSFTRNSNDKAKSFASGFHRYQMEWTSEKITFSVDDIETGTIKAKSGFWEKGDFDTKYPNSNNPWTGKSKSMAPFDEEFYISIQLAVGGSHFFTDDIINNGGDKPWRNDSSTAARDFWHARNN
ncbi:beta-1,3-glucan-binding protein-like, partial [Chironomus tepperi]